MSDQNRVLSIGVIGHHQVLTPLPGGVKANLTSARKRTLLTTIFTTGDGMATGRSNQSTSLSSSVISLT